MLNLIYKLLKLAGEDVQLNRSIYEKLIQLEAKLDEQSKKLDEIHESVVPGQATQAVLVAGPIEEQP